MAATFATLKAGIVAILEAETELSGAGQVFNYEPPIEAVTVDPFATVTASDNEAEFESTTENKRHYGFTVRVFVERRNRGESEAEALLTGIIDRLVDAFDQNYTLGVEGALLTKATPSIWSYLIGDKECRVADIKLSTMVSVDVS